MTYDLESETTNDDAEATSLRTSSLRFSHHQRFLAYVVLLYYMMSCIACMTTRPLCTFHTWILPDDEFEEKKMTL